MPEEVDDSKISDDEKKDEKVGEKGDELTLESLKEIITTQAGLLESVKTENSNNIAKVLQVVQEKYDLMDSDMKNLTNLLGGMANPDNTDAEGEDLTVPENVTKLVNKTMADNKQAESDEATKENKIYFKEYAADIQELMNGEGPDGKSLSQEARDGIKKLLIETVTEKTDNPTRDAHKNFKKAGNIFFGLDRTHEFKGGEVKGTGGGGSDNKGPTKKVYKLTDEAKKMIKDLDEDEDWAQEVLAKQAV